eukprot:scaffold644693_cov45-Prasinocladus_malaysianus.AAC.1
MKGNIVIKIVLVALHVCDDVALASTRTSSEWCLAGCMRGHRTRVITRVTCHVLPCGQPSAQRLSRTVALQTGDSRYWHTGICYPLIKMEAFALRAPNTHIGATVRQRASTLYEQCV